MEYLMTYGWAILIIAVVLGVLFQLGVFSGSALAPKAQPGSCQVQRLLGQVSLEGQCTGLLPQFVAGFTNATQYNIWIPMSLTMNTAWNGGSWTIAAWLRETNTIASASEADFIEEDTGCTSGLWIGNESSTGYSAKTYSWYSTGSACGAPVGSVSATTGKIPYNTWVLLTASFNYNPSSSGNYVQACYDGTCSQTVWAQSTPPTNFASYGYVFYIRDDGRKILSGQMANIQLYNTSLSASEVKALYLEGVGGAPVRVQSLVAWWPLNGDAKDYSGNNNNGQISGGVSFNSSWNSQYTPP